MYLHKENKELFRDAILLTSQKSEISEDIVEKDYYVTLILKKLSQIEYPDSSMNTQSIFSDIELSFESQLPICGYFII